MNTLNVLIVLALSSCAYSMYIPMYRNIWPGLMPAKFRPGYRPPPKVSSTTTEAPPKEHLNQLVETDVQECYFNQTWRRVAEEHRSNKHKWCYELANIEPGTEANFYQKAYQRMAAVEARDRDFMQKCYWQLINKDHSKPCDKFSENDTVYVFSASPRGQFRLRVYQGLKQAEQMCNTPIPMDWPVCEEYYASKKIYDRPKNTRKRRNSARRSVKSIYRFGGKDTRPSSAQGVHLN